MEKVVVWFKIAVLYILINISLIGGLDHFIFPHVGNNHPNWLWYVQFIGDETTNQIRYSDVVPMMKFGLAIQVGFHPRLILWSYNPFLTLWTSSLLRWSYLISWKGASPSQKPNFLDQRFWFSSTHVMRVFLFGSFWWLLFTPVWFSD